ncbi:hypothetical protein ASH01_14360 [Terrabacter sp. Soil811]|uniref:MarR family transcriptional regulator n=1 Tax=Terrabacter sp. Soil811 TaxID=1736419 RepID=UPI0006F20C86|nr:helix-turn-helix domain-containing protein [Terrabacter sp. Soil811]KRF45102.1 hypothetical protein ASH01_14360 [Terrabacter sp. Soil811]
MADLHTGEILLFSKAKPAPRHGQPFTMLFQDDLLAVVSSSAGAGMTALELRVLLAVWAMVGFDNLMVLNVSALARRVSAHRSSVSKAVAALERLGLLRVLGPEPGSMSRDRRLRLNPHISYRGRVGERHDAVVRDQWAPNGPALAAASEAVQTTSSDESGPEQPSRSSGMEATPDAARKTEKPEVTKP